MYPGWPKAAKWKWKHRCVPVTRLPSQWMLQSVKETPILASADTTARVLEMVCAVTSKSSPPNARESS